MLRLHLLAARVVYNDEMLWLQLLTARVVNDDEILQLETNFSKSLIRFEPVFWSEGALAAKDPDQLIVVNVEFGTTPNNGVIVVVSIDDPVILLWEQRDGFDFQLCGFVFSIITTLNDQAISNSVYAPGFIEFDIVAIFFHRLDNNLLASALRRFMWVIISLNLVPRSKVLFEVEILHNGGRGAALKRRKSERRR